MKRDIGHSEIEYSDTGSVTSLKESSYKEVPGVVYEKPAKQTKSSKKQPVVAKMVDPHDNAEALLSTRLCLAERRKDGKNYGPRSTASAATDGPADQLSAALKRLTFGGAAKPARQTKGTKSSKKQPVVAKVVDPHDDAEALLSTASVTSQKESSDKEVPVVVCEKPAGQTESSKRQPVVARMVDPHDDAEALLSTASVTSQKESSDKEVPVVVCEKPAGQTESSI
ncbi:Hypp5769 [Branchiostoma lanceolatum]|uniref:Hypp5769 protein n=1 Tax=Branchiostoma lanceolatum TaxID=7740 RepID=A0A8J9VG54_BRALA|nr:Hypp5769 [Branchiostoma lanceolatum]